jgi:hypothetical protein
MHIEPIGLATNGPSRLARFLGTVGRRAAKEDDKVALYSASASRLFTLFALPPDLPNPPGKSKQAAFELPAGEDPTLDLTFKAGKALTFEQALLAQLKRQYAATAEITGAAELMEAMKAGVLEIFAFHTATPNGHKEALDSLDRPFNKSVMNEYLEILSRALSDNSIYPLFDLDSSYLVQSGIQHGHLKVSAAAKWRSRHAALAQQILDRLPVLDRATVSEILPGPNHRSCFCSANTSGLSR